METKKRIIGLDEAVINALKLFIEKGIPYLDLGDYKRPLVVGSENAAIVGKILFEDKDAVFSDVSSYKKDLESKKVDGAILVSASGEKSAPGIAKFLKGRKIETRLLTNNEKARAIKYVDKDKVFIFPKNPEPYTYNTSTYLGMILGKTKESPEEILNFIEQKINPVVPDLKKYDAYYFIIPDNLVNIFEMFLTKFDELFGSKISARAFTLEQTKHAKTIIPSNKELFVGFGQEYDFGSKKLELPLPKTAGYGTIMAIGYYFIGKIQEQNPPWFKENIGEYLKKASKIFKEEMEVIVE